MYFLGMITEGFCKTIGALYGDTVSAAYALMVQLAEGDLFENAGLEKITGSIYTLLGVFMVFRVLISMLNYLIDPDKVNDKQAGAGKMLSRIVISIVLLLTLNSYIFPLLNKAQSVILDSGILNKIFSVDGETENYSSSVNKPGTSKINFLWQDVKAADNDTDPCKKKFECAYVYFPLPSDLTEYEVANNLLNVAGISRDADGAINAQDFYDSTIYKNPAMILLEFMPATCFDSLTQTEKEEYKYKWVDYDWMVRFSDEFFGSDVLNYNVVIPSQGESWNYGTPKAADSITDAGINGFSKLNDRICPTSISGIGCDYSNNETTCSFKTSLNNSDSLSGTPLVVFYFDPTDVDEDLSLSSFVNSTTSNNFGNSFRSLNTLNENKVRYNSFSNLRNNYQTILKNAVDADQEGVEQSKYQKQGLDFSKTVVRSFMKKTEDCDKNQDCPGRYNAYLDSGSANADLAKDIDKNRIDFDYMMALLVGIALIVILIVLCIEVIVRNFKLWLLQVISPIPVISYINPNDKIFNQWVKMYASAYVDLFIKLIAIYLAQILIDVVIESSPTGLLSILYFGAIFTFVKTVPNFISKLFGIDGAGTFGNTMGMIKAGLAGTAGAALASGASLIGAGRNMASAAQGGLGAKGVLAAGARGLGSSLGAGLRGFGAGTKGNVLGGASHAWAQASSRSNLYRQGIGTGAQLGAGFMGGVLSYAANTDRELENVKNEQDTLKRMRDHKDNVESIVESSNFGKDVINKRDSNGNFVYDTAQRKALTKSWASAQHDIVSNGANYQKFLNDNGLNDDARSRDRYVNDMMLNKTSFIDWNDLNFAVYEDGKANRLANEVINANADTSYTIEGVTSGENAITKVESISDIFELEGKATARYSSNDREIYRRTTADPRYNASKAANDARNGKG